MKKGTSVMTYYDPKTRLLKAGVAKLIHKVYEKTFKGYRLETWKCRVQGKNHLVTRTIREDLKLEEVNL